MRLPALIKPFTVYCAAARNQRDCKRRAVGEAIVQQSEISVIITKVWVESRYTHTVQVERKHGERFSGQSECEDAPCDPVSVTIYDV